MNHLVSGLVAACALVASGIAPVAAGEPSSPAVVLDGVTVTGAGQIQQVITVNRTIGTRARITFWRRTAHGWVDVARSSDARIGYGGLVVATERRQGSGTTPLGTYGLLSTFGTGVRRAGWTMPYRRIRSRDYWVEDNRSASYNRYRNRNLGGFRWWLDPLRVNGSERLADYPGQYRMSVVTSFNYDDPVHYRGAGIFLHVNGPGATAGCVSAPRWFLAQVMARLDPALHPVIAIGR